MQHLIHVISVKNRTINYSRNRPPEPVFTQKVSKKN